MNKLQEIEGIGTYHFIDAGGIGLSGLAELLVHQGHRANNWRTRLSCFTPPRSGRT